MYRSAAVMVLRKAGKTKAQYRTPGGWRPISLLNVVGKVIKTVVAERIVRAAEQYQLLLKHQIGNRIERFTELAIRMVTETVYTT